MDISEEGTRIQTKVAEAVAEKSLELSANAFKALLILAEKEKNKLRGGNNNLRVLLNNNSYNSLSEVDIDKDSRQSIIKDCKKVNIPVACIKNENGTYRLVFQTKDNDKLKEVFNNNIKQKLNTKNKQEKEEKEKGNIEKNIERAKEKANNQKPTKNRTKVMDRGER